MQIFIAQTIDGYIAGPDDSLDHLTPFNDPDFGYDAFIATVDSVVLGRKTFDVIYPDHGWTYPSHLPGCVLTSRPLPDDVPDNVIGTADIDRVAAEYSNAFVDGGAQVIRTFCDRNLIREARIFTLPILLGDGTQLFASGAATQQSWTLIDTRRFPCGTVLTHYKI
ncbi:MAG: hypothetical protein GKS00_03185 [Alphaproteobacteria bacterium]|nr:hypothetical protein [Alphaproteobacteria bacterium]